MCEKGVILIRKCSMSILLLMGSGSQETIVLHQRMSYEWKVGCIQSVETTHHRKITREKALVKLHHFIQIKVPCRIDV